MKKTSRPSALRAKSKQATQGIPKSSVWVSESAGARNPQLGSTTAQVKKETKDKGTETTPRKKRLSRQSLPNNKEYKDKAPPPPADDTISNSNNPPPISKTKRRATKTKIPTPTRKKRTLTRTRIGRSFPTIKTAPAPIAAEHINELIQRNLEASEPSTGFLERTKNERLKKLKKKKTLFQRLFSSQRHEPKMRGKVANPIGIFWLFRLTGKLYTTIIWEAIITVATCMHISFLLYEAIFELFGSIVWAFILIIDGLFFFDLILRLLTEIYRFHSRSECTFFLIPFSVQFYLWEMAMLFPLEWIAVSTDLLSTDSLTSLDIFDYFRLHRLFRIRRVFKFFTWLELERKLDEFWVFIFKFFIFYILFIQIVACVLYQMAKKDILLSVNEDKNIQENSWFGDIELIKPGFVHIPFNHYILSLSFATGIVTTVGYGDVSPKIEYEMLVTILIMLIGAILMGGLFGSNLASFLLERDGKRFDLFYRVKRIQKNLKELGSTTLFSQTLEEYYNCLWNFREGVYHVQFIHYLPTSMHEDILFDICTEMFHKALLFRGLEEPFLRAVCRAVEVVLYNPDMILCQQGDYAMTMYYIIQGECLVKSKNNTNITTAILRAGCVFGESSLFFSFPYATNVETRTCCQLLKLQKEKLMDVFSDHIYNLNFMRSRIQDRMTELRTYYEEMGQHPITWVQLKQKFVGKQTYANYPTNLRWLGGLNRRVKEDIIDDTERPIIVGMDCLDSNLGRDNTTVYSTCVIPPTLIADSHRVHYWHLFIIGLTSIMAFVGPLNLAFRRTTEFIYYVDLLVHFLNYLVMWIFIADVVLEILTACPVSGLHYKLKDGLRASLKKFGFYLDFFAAIPFQALSFFATDSSFGWAPFVSSLSQALKLWKIIRYLHFLDDFYPEHLFWFRLFQVAVMLIYCIHFLACIMFSLACTSPPLVSIGDHRACHTQSWLSSYYIQHLVDTNELNEELAPWQIANTIPYLISIYFATSTLSSTGYGDFSPHSIVEMCILTVAQVLGFYIVGYYTSLLTSALSCTTRPKINFQQKLVSIRQFLSIHGLGGDIEERIIEHYRLQFQYNEGVSLPHGTKHLMYDCPPYLEEDALFTETEIHLEGIPLFTRVDPKIIVRMGKYMDRYVLPPNIYFLRRGDVRRQMYVIYKGSVAILHEDTTRVKGILEATGHFGDRDLLFGEPSFNHIKTLSFCIIYAIDFQSYKHVFGKDDELQTDVAEMWTEENQKITDTLTETYTLLRKNNYKSQCERAPTKIRSFINFPTRERPHADFCDYEEFMEPYEGRWGAILRLLLMRRTIHPAGTFALCWQIIMAVASMILIIGTCIMAGSLNIGEHFRYHRTIGTYIIFTDVYVKMHWAYFTASGHLISHPVKTASHYLFDGPFIFSFFCGIVPYEDLLNAVGDIQHNADGDGIAWFSKLRWHRLFLIVRTPILIQYGRNVFKNRQLVLLLMYLVLTLAVCTIITSFALYQACPWNIDPFEEAHIELLPACLEDTWVAKKKHVGSLSGFATRWILGVYFVSQTALVVGYGDFASIKDNEILLAIFMMIVGFMIMRIIISDMTAAAVDSDEIRAVYSEQIKCLHAVLKRENIHPRLISNTMEHLKHTWLMSRGLQPQDLLKDLHPALQSDLYKEFIGTGDKGLARFPVLNGVTDNILHTICQHIRKLYFTRGERIMRRGNLSYEMYFIDDGDVWICGRNMELKCSLGPGESMGETQMVHATPRKYSAIAANNVELFVLKANNFAEILVRYPGLKLTMLTNLGNANDDLFERKICFIQERIAHILVKREAQEAYDDKAYEHTKILKGIVLSRETPGAHEDDDDSEDSDKENGLVQFFREWIFDYGPDDFDLPFFYLASPTVLKKFSFQIHPKCGFQQVFEVIVMAVCLLSPALASYQVTFAVSCLYNQSSVYFIVLYITWAFEIIMMLHIVIQFLTPFPTVEGKFCKQYRKIAFRYTSTFSRFGIDLIATLPIQLIDNVMCEAPDTDSVISYINTVRFLRLIHYYRTQAEKQDSITITTFRYKLSISVPFFALMAHFLACIFYNLSPCSPHTSQCDKLNTWTYAFTQSFRKKEIVVPPDQIYRNQVLWYVRSLYWVVTTISTTGFGDITAQNLNEITIAIITVFCGAFVLSIILSGFTSGITSLTKANREYMYQVKLLAKYLTNIGLNHERQDQVLTWFLMLWDACRGASYSSVTEVLPLCLQMDINQAIHENILQEVSLFDKLGKRFIRQVATRVNHTVYLAGFNIVNEGDKGHTLFIVSKGWVAGYVKTRNGQPKLMRWYGTGTCFGRLPVLFYNQCYTKSYRAEVNSEILYLHQSDIFHLAHNFPTFAENLQEVIRHKYLPELGTGTIFSSLEVSPHAITGEIEKKVKSHLQGENRNYYHHKYRSNRSHSLTNSKKSERRSNPMYSPGNSARSNLPRKPRKSMKSKSREYEEDGFVFGSFRDSKMN